VFGVRLRKARREEGVESHEFEKKKKKEKRKKESRV